MKDFPTLLKRIFKALNKDTLERESVLFELKNNAGVTLSPENIFIREGVLEISASPTVKNEIKLKEELILNTLKNGHNLSYNRVLYK